MNIFEQLIVLLVGSVVGFILALSLMSGYINEKANSPELKQCLMMSGTEWRDGSCVIKLK